jgi:hypothetical protein
MAGGGDTSGEVVLSNEPDTIEVGRLMGLEKFYDLGYRNHLMDGVGRLELRARREQFDAGLEPHAVREKYYFARGPQLVNRVVYISSYVEGKIEVNRANVTQGPAGDNGSRLRRRLAAEGKRLPLLGDDDATADRNYICEFVLEPDREWGRRYGVECAEPFHYVGPPRNRVEEYVRDNAAPL